MTKPKPCDHKYMLTRCTRDKYTYTCVYCGAAYDVPQYDEYDRTIGRG